ncbi:MAG: XRE family transcriptional regulator [Acidobacteria bacterium]|nr:MAG: XRE family transcriptional regulator [Acidobacteriota bacterium]
MAAVTHHISERVGRAPPDTYIGAIERGERNISLATLEALATGLGCDPVDLLDGYRHDRQHLASSTAHNESLMSRCRRFVDRTGMGHT